MHKHIKRDDRICIVLMLRQGYTYTQIGKELSFNKSTITREIKRNSKNGIYKVPLANRQARARRKLSKINYRIIDNDLELKRKIKYYLKKDYSPEQITGTYGLCSHMTIYRYVYRDRKSTRLNSSHIPLSRMPSSA